MSTQPHYEWVTDLTDTSISRLDAASRAHLEPQYAAITQTRPQAHDYSVGAISYYVEGLRK